MLGLNDDRFDGYVQSHIWLHMLGGFIILSILSFCVWDNWIYYRFLINNCVLSVVLVVVVFFIAEEMTETSAKNSEE